MAEEQTLAEIEAMMEKAAMGNEPVKEAEPETAPEPAPESEPQPSQEEESKPEPQTPEDQPEPDVDEREILRSQLSEMEARAKHWEQVAGKHAGKLGWLEREVLSIKARPQQPSGEDEYPVQPAEADTASRPDNLVSWVVRKAVEEAGASFAAKHPDFTDHMPQIQEYLTQSGFDAGRITASGDPIQASRDVTSTLEEAYWHSKANKESVRRVELEKKRADQTSKLAEAKKKAAVSASASTPAPKPVQKTQNEMSLDEIDAELMKVTGGRW